MSADKRLELMSDNHIKRHSSRWRAWMQGSTTSRLSLIVLTSTALALFAIVYSDSFSPILLHFFSTHLHNQNNFDFPRSPANMSAALRVSRSVIKKVYAQETSEGVGATVRRTIGTPQLRNLSPFLMLARCSCLFIGAERSDLTLE